MKPVKEIEFYNCIVRVYRDVYQEIYYYEITYPGEIVVSSFDYCDNTNLFGSIQDAIEDAIKLICDGEVDMLREWKLSCIFE